MNGILHTHMLGSYVLMNDNVKAFFFILTCTAKCFDPKIMTDEII
jgi:hypothetical protein